MVAVLATTVHGAELRLQLNQEIFTAGETLSLTASADPQGVLVDVYIGLVSPSGELFFLTPAGLTETLQTLTPDGLATSASAEIFRYTLTGSEPSGPYIWLGVLTAHDTLDFVSDVEDVPFLVVD
jgi:hypothetical protein